MSEPGILSNEERQLLIQGLLPHFADYHASPIAYDFDGFHSGWSESLHAMACELAASRGRFGTLNEKHVASAVGTAVAHWTNMWDDWRPPRDLTVSEWDDIVAIAEAVGVRGLRARRKYFESRTWVMQTRDDCVAETEERRRCEHAPDQEGDT